MTGKEGSPLFTISPYASPLFLSLALIQKLGRWGCHDNLFQNVHGRTRCQLEMNLGARLNSQATNV